ncbi:MAG: DUF934 domain-containing protein [Bradyrhizobiaceae bacterium]|nr:DUF934 domain-containing protein [Bradyrhizobiaceae bacterium]
MPLVKNGTVIADPYVTVTDDAVLPDDGAVIVTGGRLVADAGKILMRKAPVGVVWPNNKNVADLAPFLDRLAVVALVFPSFKDGRAYSQARVLRERFGFRGELRATGEVLRDQFVFLVRAGFDALDVAKAEDAEAFAPTLSRYTVFYQPAGPLGAPASRLRSEKAPERVA